MNTRTRRTLKRLGLLAVLLPVVLFACMLFFSKIESTRAGVHKHLLIPLLGLAHVKLAMPAGTGDVKLIPGMLDGPVVKTGPGATWMASWFCEHQVQRQTGSGERLTLACAGKSHHFTINAAAAQPEPAVVPMPDKLLILSDIEGNLAYLDGVLRKLGVVDAGGAWNYGANRIIVAGDSVDRGRDVFQVLWRLHALSLQAKVAGGGVHVLLGNHEQYLLRGNTAKAHPEHVFALQQLGGPAAAFGADTVIGDWLRQLPVLFQAGRVLVAHGGVSEAVAKQGLTVEQINAAMRRYWRAEPVPVPALEAVLGMDGVTQYRGHIDSNKELYAQSSDVDLALRAFDVDTIVVGHTIVEKVTGLHFNKVYAVNVNSNDAAPQALLFVNGVATVVDTGTPRLLPEGKTPTITRSINLLSGADWNTLSQVARRSYQLARLPTPY